MAKRSWANLIRRIKQATNTDAKKWVFMQFVGLSLDSEGDVWHVSEGVLEYMLDYATLDKALREFMERGEAEAENYPRIEET